MDDQPSDLPDLVPLEAVLITDEVRRRTLRAPNYELESQLHSVVVEALANAPESVLQCLAQEAMRLCNAESAGVSLLNKQDGERTFVWPAVVGEWSRFVGAGTPSDFSPCADVLARGTSLVFCHPERRYPYLKDAVPGIEEAMLAPVFVGSKAVGTVWVIAHRANRHFDSEDLRQLTNLTKFASIAYQVAEREREFQAEFTALTRLRELVTRLLPCTDLKTALEEVLSAIIDTTGADMGNVQLLDPNTQTLHIAAQRGFEQEFLEHFRTVSVESDSACAHALRTARRFISDDVHRSFDPAHRAQAIKAGYVSVQSTPLLSAKGELLGVLSTHYRTTHQFTERDLRILDLYARPAADFIARMRTDEELRQMAANLAQADRRKTEFLALLSHELRNPLAPIQNSLSAVKLAGRSAANFEEMTAMIERQVAHMVRLIDDLLDVSRITQDKLKLKTERVDFVVLVQQAIQAIQPLCDRNGVDIKVELPNSPLWLLADAVRIAQVVGNLLNNACKFSERNGRIDVSLWKDGQTAVLRVKDVGIGINREHLPRIFDLFAQVESAVERSQSGLGIGLSLVKRLTEMHGGTISVDSAGPGQGAEFVVRLPITDEQGDAEHEAYTPNRSPSVPRRVLVVDDNKDSADSLALLLKMLGHEARAVYDGRHGLSLIAEFSPQVAFLDIGMPGLNGYELSRLIRARPHAKSLKLVALTGLGQEEDRQRASEAGFDLHLVKPVTVEALIAVLGCQV